VDGEARIVHSDRQDRYDGNLSNSLSRGSFVRKNDNHHQIRDQSNRITDQSGMPSAYKKK